MSRAQPVRITLTIHDETGRSQSFAYVIEPHEVLDTWPGKRDPFNPNPIPALMRRAKRNNFITRMGRMLGRQAADWLDDRDGWNGEKRAETIMNLDPRYLDHKQWLELQRLEREG